MVIVVLTDRYVRVVDWVRGRCFREIAVESFNDFHILKRLIRNTLRNVMIVYKVGC